MRLGCLCPYAQRPARRALYRHCWVPLQQALRRWLLLLVSRLLRYLQVCESPLVVSLYCEGICARRVAVATVFVPVYCHVCVPHYASPLSGHCELHLAPLCSVVLLNPETVSETHKVDMAWEARCG